MKTIALPDTFIGAAFQRLENWCERAARSDKLRSVATQKWDEECREEFGDPSTSVRLVGPGGAIVTQAWIGLIVLGAMETFLSISETGGEA